MIISPKLSSDKKFKIIQHHTIPNICTFNDGHRFEQQIRATKFHPDLATSFRYHYSCECNIKITDLSAFDAEYNLMMELVCCEGCNASYTSLKFLTYLETINIPIRPPPNIYKFVGFRIYKFEYDNIVIFDISSRSAFSCTSHKICPDHRNSDVAVASQEFVDLWAQFARSCVNRGLLREIVNIILQIVWQQY